MVIEDGEKLCGRIHSQTPSSNTENRESLLNVFPRLTSSYTVVGPLPVCNILQRLLLGSSNPRSWIGWFPWMFWGALWIGEICTRQNSCGPHGDDESARAASQSLMYYALVALFTSILLPLVVTRHREGSLQTSGNSPSSRLGWRTPVKMDLITWWALSQAIFASCLFATM